MDKLVKPEWLKVKSNTGKQNVEVMEMLRALNLHTVCEEACCPNAGECFGKRTATFMILGSNCTRNCRFCTVTKGDPALVDPHEPEHIAQAVKKLGLKHVVVTSVTRDDLPDGGAFHFADVINAVRDLLGDKAPIIEVLIPDFKGDLDALMKVIDAKPEIINHNIETVSRLYSEVRPQAVYERSLELIRRVKEIAPTITTKSGIMVGLGEKYDEVVEVMQELHDNSCDMLTIGQYLAPSLQHHPVIEYVHPDTFDKYKVEGEKIGFKCVVSGPLVRSSYMAEHAFSQANK